MQDRLERTTAGRAFISAMLVVTLAAIGATNLPASETRARLSAVAQPYLNATGLDQAWGIFAPNPRRLIIYVESHIEHVDGTTTVRPVPAGHGLAAYRDYRWHKYAEQLHLDVHAALWPVFARHVAEQERAEGREPVRITLVRQVALMLPPGPGPETEPYHEERFFTLDLRETP